MKKNPVIIGVFILLFALPLKAQETIGLAEISNYLHDETGAGAQNWEIAQDKKGFMYFANNSGLLTYTNKEWKLFPLPNRTIVRAIAISGNGRIYAGGQDAIGYFSPDKQGQLSYTDLTGMLPSGERNFGDVWRIINYQGDYYFRTSSRIFRYHPGEKAEMTIYKSPTGFRWSFMGLSNNILYAQNGKESLVYFTGKEWKPVGKLLLGNTLITGVLPYKSDTTLITTLRGGVFLLAGAAVRPLPVPETVIKAQLYSAITVNDSVFALGTVSKGIYFLTKTGRVIRHFSTESRMQNNNVLSMYVDDQQNLWAGLDEGIDRIRFNSPVKIIPPVYNEKLPVYTVKVAGNTLYTGTSDGVYACPLFQPGNHDISLETSRFTRIESTEGQVWNISESNGKILVGHHDGSLLIKGNRSFLMGRIGGGTWKFRNLPDNKRILTGTYAGLQSLVPQGDGFITQLIPGSSLNESLRFVEIDTNKHVVWASHPYRGIYRLDFNADFSAILNTVLFTAKDGLPDDLNNFVFTVNNEIIFATVKGIYRYDWSEKKFRIHEQYKPVFGQLPIKYMTSDQHGRIWFVSDRKPGVADNRQLRFFPELEGMLVAGFEHIYPMDDENIFAGGYKGIIHLNYQQYNDDSTGITTWLNKVTGTAGGNKLLFNGFIPAAENNSTALPGRLAPFEHSLHFEYACNIFGRQGQILYSYRLKGLDNNWSAWSPKTEKDYTNLTYGQYSFEVRAMDHLGNISQITRFSFEIAPRWYQTNLAFVMYFLLLAFLLWGANRLHRQRLEKERQKFEKEEALLRHLHELELDRNEKEIIKLKNDHLETEVSFKNKELASTTMHLYKRGRLLGKLKDELTTATQNLSSKEERVHFNKLLKLITEEEKMDHDWEQFAIHFDQVHNQFLSRIKQLYPDLTASDLKIAAYIKMTLSSKEIAQLLNISLKGVEIARYRLRKKLNLETTESLAEFILRIQ